MWPVGMIIKRWVWLLGDGIYVCGYQEVDVVRMYRYG